MIYGTTMIFGAHNPVCISVFFCVRIYDSGTRDLMKLKLLGILVYMYTQHVSMMVDIVFLFTFLPQVI